MVVAVQEGVHSSSSSNEMREGVIGRLRGDMVVEEELAGGWRWRVVVPLRAYLALALNFEHMMCWKNEAYLTNIYQ